MKLCATRPSSVTPTRKSVYFDPLVQLIDSLSQADLINSAKSLTETATHRSVKVASWETNLSAIDSPLNSDINDETNGISQESSTRRMVKPHDPIKIHESRQSITTET